MKTFLALVALTASTALAQPAAPSMTMPPLPETITVTGSGRANVTPDRVTFMVGVQTVAPTVEEAVNQNNARIAAVTAALRKAGATDAQIRTSNFSIYPQQDYSQGQLPRILGYLVSNNITVTREQVGDAGKLLQAAVSAGVNTSTGLSFVVSDPARGRAAGLRAAFDDARSKATVLAQSAGRTLGRAMTITEGVQGDMPRPMPMAARAMSMKAEVSEVPVESGSQEVGYSVTVTFELR